MFNRNKALPLTCIRLKEPRWRAGWPTSADVVLKLQTRHHAKYGLDYAALSKKRR
jgi:hypothetical protein